MCRKHYMQEVTDGFKGNMTSKPFFTLTMPTTAIAEHEWIGGLNFLKGSTRA